MRLILLAVLLCSFFFCSFGQHVSQLRFTPVPGLGNNSTDFYKNRFLVLDFWATWCGPCIASMPHLSELEQAFASDSTVVFATITAESSTTVQRYLKRKSLYLTKHPLMDTTRQSWENFQISAIPVTLIFSPDGNLIFRGNPRELNRELLTSILEGESIVSLVNAEKAPEKPQQLPRYLFQISDADSSLSAPEFNTSKTTQYFTFNGNGISIRDCFISLSSCSPLRLIANDSLRFNQPFACEARLEHALIPFVPKQITCDSLTDAFLYELATHFRFEASWTTIKTQTLELVVTGEGLPESAETNSTYGKSSSYDGTILSFVNYSPAELALELEKTALLQFPVFSCIDTCKKYDFLLDITDENTLKTSLQTYGLQLRLGGRKRVKMLRISF